MTRNCYKCKTEKPLTDFRRNRANTLGYSYICKECGRIESRLYWQKVKGTEKGKEITTRSSKRAWSDPKTAEKMRCRQTTRNAIKAGKLEKQPCINCGSVDVVAHHKDYSKPFEITWLCVPCHQQHHRERGDYGKKFAQELPIKICPACFREKKIYAKGLCLVCYKESTPSHKPSYFYRKRRKAQANPPMQKGE